jgi:molecular chaperone DnaK
LRIHIGDKKVSLGDVLSGMLRKLSYIINDHLETTDWQCIITVPAYFNEEQRNILWTSIRLSNIRCIKLLNEPSSACIAYLQNKTYEAVKILVVDFGAGTLDLSVIDVEKNEGEVFCEVCATYGNNALGGIDITRVLSEELNVSLQEADDLKKINDYKITLDLHFGGAVRECIDKVLEIAKTSVDEVLLIGGSSKLPWLRGLVRGHLDIVPVRSLDNFEERAVSMGAALHCDHIANHRNIILVDRIPLSVGVNANDLMNVIIPRNTAIPTSKTKMYTTEDDNQTSVKIDVYQGESKFLDKNVLIGSFELNDIPELPKGVPVVYVTIKIDVNGIIEVKAREKRGDQQKELRIKRDAIDDETIKEMMSKVDREKEQLYHRVHTSVYKLYSLVEKVNFQVFENCVLDLEDEVRQKVFDDLIEPVIHTVSLLKPYEQEFHLNLRKWNHILELDEEVEKVNVRTIVDRLDKWSKVILDKYSIYVIAEAESIHGYTKDEKGDDL